MMLKRKNIKAGGSIHNPANGLRWTSAHCEQAKFCKVAARANRTRSSRETSPYSRITGWSLALLMTFGLFSYLTFIPEQVSAAYDWETRTLEDIDTMQEMNAKICENTTEIGRQYRLEDIRINNDGKMRTYWVSKLADGNCWMTQNLDYDISNKAQQDISKWDGSTVTNTTVAYYDPDVNLTNGQKYYYDGSDGKHGWNSTACTENTTGLSSCSTQGFKAAVPANDEKDHYLVGNYYSWPAATMTGGVSGQDSSSVCPTNWRLPTSGADTGEFRELMLAYGWTTSNPANIALNMNVNPDDSNDKRGIFGDPLYFVYGGGLSSGKLYGAGRGGYYWSSTPYSDGTVAYSLYFNSGVNPSDDYYRYLGFSVRCVVRDDAYPEQPLDSNSQANVAITVSPVISIDVTQHVDTQVDFTRVAKSEIRARVGSNQPYQVLLSTEKSALTNGDIEQNIPMVASDQKIVAGTSSWGIKKLTNLSDTEVDAETIYSPVGINGNKALFYTSNTAAAEDLIFPIAIAVNQQLPQGTYSTQVTLTAVAM